MKRLIALVVSWWHYEPVLMGALVPVLTTAGLTAAEANSIQATAEGVAAIVAQAAVAFGVRAKVKPEKKAVTVNIMAKDNASAVLQQVQAAAAKPPAPPAPPAP